MMQFLSVIEASSLHRERNSNGGYSNVMFMHPND